MNIASVPKDVVNIYNNALELSNRGEYDTALAEYERAIEKFPAFIEAYNNIGEIYSSLGNRDEAITIYKKALGISKNHRVLLNLGVEYYNSNNFSLSLDYFLQSLELKKDFTEGNFYTGMAYYNLKDFTKAEKYFSAVTKTDKKHTKANFLLSCIYYEWKQYEKAIKCLDCIKETSDDARFINKYYGFCHYHLGKYDKAISYLSSALEASPEYERLKDYINGLTYENKVKEIGDITAAIRELEESLMKERPDTSKMTRLSMLYIFNGENSKAEEILVSYKQKLAS